MANKTHVRRLLMGIVGCALSALLLFLLVKRYPVDMESLGALLGKARWLGLAGIVATTGIHCLVSAHKWRLVTEVGDRGRPMQRGFYWGFTVLIALAGQVMPLQVAILAGRSLALRMHAQVPLRRGALGALYDQGFDLLLPALALAPGALYFLGWIPGGGALGLWLLLVLACGASLAAFGNRAVGFIAACALKGLPQRVQEKFGLARVCSALPEYLGHRIIVQLYLWSTLRVVNLVFRTWLVVWTVRLDMDVAPLAFGHCAISFSALLNFVPGALGVAEWGWVSILGWAGASPEDAVHVALSIRVLVLASLLLVNGLTVGFYLVYRRLARQTY